MKDKSVILLLFSAIYGLTEAKAVANGEGANISDFIYRGTGDLYLPLWECLSDGEPRVFEDPDNPGKYRTYIIDSHDVRFRSCCGADTRVWSAPVEDLSARRDEGPTFTYQIDGKWDIMYAPGLVEARRKNGKEEYYLYPRSRGRHREAMVAKEERPDRPFTPINLATDGTKTLPGSITGLDPLAYIEYITDSDDPDYEISFRAYGYQGFRRSLVARLDQKTVYSVRPGTDVIPYFTSVDRRSGMVRDSISYPHIYPGEDLGAFNFFETSPIRKIENKYVMVYDGYPGREYGLDMTNSTLCYAYDDLPLDPWKSEGVPADPRAPVLNQNGTHLETSDAARNTHGSIEQINEQWYVFYYHPPRGFESARQAMVAPIHVEQDEKAVPEGGKVSVKGHDPYARDGIWAAKDAQGNEYKDAGVASEGFRTLGPDSYQYYSAGFACYLSDVVLQQDTWDIWNNHASIINVKNGNMMGYKYFGFGGPDKDKLGLRAFKGTQKGSKTTFNLLLTPETSKTLRVNVWLDGPWSNAAWKGTKVGEISVPGNSVQGIIRFTVDVSKLVDHLDKKYATFLIAEGEEGEELFGLIGLGFSSERKDIARPVVPRVNIAIDRKQIKLPVTPICSTESNGILGYDLYETVYKLPSNTADLPKVSATVTDKNAKTMITQASSSSKTAIVKFNCKGLVEIYKIKFNASMLRGSLSHSMNG